MATYLKPFDRARATVKAPQTAERARCYCRSGGILAQLVLYDKTSGFRKITVATIVIVASWSMTYGFLGWVPCIPVHAFWDLTLPATRYGFASLYVVPFVTIYTSLTASNMVLDIIILALAAPLLLRSQESNEKSRWALGFLFAFGSIAIIFSTLRLASIVDTEATTSPTFDPTWYGSTPIVYAALEVDIATITAALPVFWPVLVNLSNRTQILVTREVKVTLEHRSDPDDDAIELQRSKSGLQTRTTRSDYYDDPYIAEQVNPFKGPQFGVKADVDANQNQSRDQ
ncbi:hypothetical protein N0V93_010226 [Gnomoniopsis smithogilvyi]|uniref:Rhodopsin domain-containing protein n=1 Tax=Gnomoniopsis smithogilvyi TaxID=1191159 RepID=A0A9W9CT36_9PEZI|nr:hypothetical protein N0V93_010226 [Gnomoniopsis smithogilvyi]